MLRVGLQGMNIDETGRKPATLIFVIDVSGSMNRENRLGTVKKSLRILVDQLGEGDRVGIVTYGSQGRVLLEPADLNRRDEILRAIESLAPGGSTNAVEGLDLAYDLARDHLDRDGINRLILCSDGVANMGATEAEEILAKYQAQLQSGHQPVDRGLRHGQLQRRAHGEAGQPG
jgi:Ca-activated chloride channel family protein